MILDQLITATVSAIGVAVSLAYYPQAWKVFKTKSSHDISAFSYLMFSIGNTSWLLYGLYKDNLPLIASFLFGAIGAWLVLLLTLYYRNRREVNKGP